MLLKLLCPRTRTLPSVHEVGPCNYRMRLATGQKTSTEFLATNLAYPDLLNRKNPVVTIGAEGQRQIQPLHWNMSKCLLGRQQASNQMSSVSLFIRSSFRVLLPIPVATMSNQTNDSRIEVLEISIAHQQRLLEQLNEVVTEHSKILMQLEKSIPKLREELLELRAAQNANSAPPADEKPPHY